MSDIEVISCSAFASLLQAKWEALQPCNTHSNGRNKEESGDDAHDWTPQDEPSRRSGLSVKSEVKAEADVVTIVDDVPSTTAAGTQIGQQVLPLMYVRVWTFLA